MFSCMSIIKKLAFWRQGSSDINAQRFPPHTFVPSPKSSFEWTYDIPDWSASAEPSDLARYVRSEIQYFLEEMQWYIRYSAERDKIVMYLGDSDINRILTLLVANAPEGIDRRFKEEVWLMKVLAYGHKGVYNRHFAPDLQMIRRAQTLIISFANKRSPARGGVPTNPQR